jgi:putative CocE/NonD family hydrolase
MRRGLKISAALAAAFALLPAAASAAKPHWTDYDRPAEFGVATQNGAEIPMRDGVVLEANIQRPDAEGEFPALIIQTPYNKDGAINLALGGAANYFVERGYVVVTVDVRGTGASQGTWDSFGPDEQRDGVDVVKWARTQPWSSGKIGLYGPSYMAITQLTTAARDPKGLKAIFPIVPMSDSYRDIVFSGGQINAGFIPFWLGLVTAGSLTPSVPPTDPLDLIDWLQDTLTAMSSHLLGVPGFQVSTVLNGATGGDLAFDGPFWKTRSPLELVDRINVPAFVIGGHHDLFQRGEPLIYERLKRQVNARLLIGPWTHVQGSTGQGLPRDGVPALNSIALRWFDRYLYGMDTHVEKIPRVTQFVYGKDRYRTQRDWPNPKLDPKTRYLRNADAGGTGELSPKPPATTEDSLWFTQNPLVGICTLSTSQWTAGLGDAIPCTTEDRINEALGAAAYLTPPLKRPLNLDGPILANLWLTTTAQEAITAVRFYDVAPGGDATELTAGWLAGSFRKVDRTRSRYVRGKLLQPWHPFTEDSVLPVEPGEPVRLPVEVFPTRATLGEGHQLKLVIQGGDFPHQVPPIQQLTGSLLGQIEILTEPGHRSSLTLPVLGHRSHPINVPDLIRGD